MNLVDHVVTKVNSEPFFKYGKWFVKVTSDCYGRLTESELMFSTEEAAKAVQVGHVYLA